MSQLRRFSEEDDTLHGLNPGQFGLGSTSYDVYPVYLRENTTYGVPAPAGTKLVDTGKVVIGCRWQAPRFGKSEVLAALQNKRESRVQAAAELALYIVSALAFLVIYLTWGGAQ